jgi:hypothetical protein
MDINAEGTVLTLTYTKCKEQDTLTDGKMIMTGDDTSASFTLGSASAPFTVTTYDVSSGVTSTTINNVDKTAMTMKWSSTTAAPITDTIVADGWMESWDYVGDTHEKIVMSNVTMKNSSSVSTIGTSKFDVDTTAIDGSWVSTVYPTATAATASLTETDTFKEFTLKYEHPQYGVTAADDFDYLSMNGTFEVNSLPADKCIDGQFTIVTNTPIKVDNATGNTIAGKMTINGNAVAVFNADGSVTVTVDGKAVTLTEKELEDLCGY